MQIETPMPVFAGVETRSRILISAELIAYVAILAVALVLRFANLDSVALMPTETHNALAAWRSVSADAPGVSLIPTSAILFDVQSISFGLMGASEFSARVATALAGAALILLPALFRSWLGKTGACLTSLLLALSPVLLIASRTSSADVWALLLAGFSLWGYAQTARTGQGGYTIFAVAAFGVMALLTGAGGVALALILAGAGVIAWLSQRRNDLLDDEAEVSWFAPLRGSFGLALGVAGLVVIVLATGFLLYPVGLSSIGVGLGDAVRAVIEPHGIGGYAVLIALFYAPFLWVLAVAGLFARRYQIASMDRFLAAWVILAVIVSLLFADGVADHALWISVPLAVLAARALERTLTPEESTIFAAAPSWARWLVATSAAGVFAVFTIAFESAGRSLVQAADGTLATANFEPDSAILLLIAVLFLVIGYFLFASLWGSRTAWQGLGIGLAIFGGLTSLGAGWNAVVTNADVPVVFWHMTATHGDATLLRQTLFEIADRQTGGLPTMPVTVMAPQDGIVAWLLRDFSNADFIKNVGDAIGDEVVLLPGSLQQLNLGSSYVGQDFVVTRTWDSDSMRLIDLPGWWAQQQARSPWTGEDVMNLWLRQDVYNGTTPDQGTG